MSKAIKKVVVVGGGTAGWMSAALIKKVLGPIVDIELVESEEIGTVGVGEATIPPIKHVNSVLGIDEAEFLRETKATIKLGIQFEDWLAKGDSYVHTFGSPGKSVAFCQFHHFWVRAKQLGIADNMWNYDLNYLCAMENKFAPISTRDPNLELHYAYHFDASLYAKYLRKFSEKLGVVRTEGLVENVELNHDSGFVERLTLKNGKVIGGDLFVDCSGFRGLLIQEKLGAGYEDWGHWLPCDRAMAVPSERMDETLPYTRSIAHSAGWQWRIPLQHRNGNGLVYSSSHYSDDEAANLLLSNLGSKALGDPRPIRFRTGRRLKQWSRNVVAVGLSSGFLEPLESTSIHLIQSAIVRLIKLFPHNGIDPSEVAEYNKQSKIEFEQIRDFIILHYHVNERDDSQFWRDMRNMDVPDSLAHKIELFRTKGKLVRENEDLFWEASWLQVMMGQGIMPQDYHPLADSITEAQLGEMLANLKRIKSKPLAQLSTHDQFLEKVCAR